MSLPSRNRVREIGIYKAPPGLSRAEFETQFKATIIAMLELPIVQKNFLKHEMTNAMIVVIFEAESHNATGGGRCILTITHTSLLTSSEVAEYPPFRSLMIVTSQSIGLDVGEIFATEVITTIDK
ncbi:hypothetical protein FB451DRAFT_1175180 [Mycena latifolia]|nr:hypothetical protein FB451DRAFT_1175180 [Mycena latifolia]